MENELFIRRADRFSQNPASILYQNSMTGYIITEFSEGKIEVIS
jgi:hypothetical protein